MTEKHTRGRRLEITLTEVRTQELLTAIAQQWQLAVPCFGPRGSFFPPLLSRQNKIVVDAWEMDELIRLGLIVLDVSTPSHYRITPNGETRVST